MFLISLLPFVPVTSSFEGRTSQEASRVTQEAAGASLTDAGQLRHQADEV